MIMIKKNIRGWKIPLEKGGKVYKALAVRGYSPKMTKIKDSRGQYALVGVRVCATPWDPLLIKLLREADRIVREALK